MIKTVITISPVEGGYQVALTHNTIHEPAWVPNWKRARALAEDVQEGLTEMGLDVDIVETPRVQGLG